MKGDTVVCPQCERPLGLPAWAFEKWLSCSECGWSAIPQTPEPSATGPEQEPQVDILTDYHDRLVGLYDGTTPLADLIRAQATAEAAIRESLERRTRLIDQLLESARIEIDAIFYAAEHEAARVKFEAEFPRKIRCPHCRRVVRYNDRAAGMSLQCPNRFCRRAIAIPAQPAVGDSFWTAVDFIDG